MADPAVHEADPGRSRRAYTAVHDAPIQVFTLGRRPQADARPDGRYVRALARLASVDVLIIDDRGHVPLKGPGPAQPHRDPRRPLRPPLNRHDLQLPTTKWHDHIGDPTAADAICDRVHHNAHRLVLKGHPPGRRNPSRPKTRVQRRFAPTTMVDPRDPDAAIWAITMAGMRPHHTP